MQGNQRRREQVENEVPRREETNDDDDFVDAEDFENFEPAPPNTEVDFEAMAQNYFARVDEIH